MRMACWRYGTREFKRFLVQKKFQHRLRATSFQGDADVAAELLTGRSAALKQQRRGLFARARTRAPAASRVRGRPGLNSFAPARGERRERAAA